MRVRVDTSDTTLPPLRAGMSVEVDVDTGHARGLPHFLTALFGRAETGGVMSAATRAADGGNRAAITVCVMLATIMQALDTTIANVALPYMQGSVSASAGPDQLGADLLHRRGRDHDAADRLARRRGSAASACSSSAVAGFTVASMLCGMAQSLTQIVLFRLLQGMFGAALVPLSQAVLLDIYPPRSAAPPWRCWASRSWSARSSARCSAAG